MSDDDFFRSYLLNFDQSMFPDDEDDEDYMEKPEEASGDDDDEDPPSQEVEQPPVPSSLKLESILMRFDVPMTLPTNQLFLTTIPEPSALPESLFSVAQWDLLRHQCRIHFALLCRSLRFVTFCASSDAILAGLLSLLHTFNMIFKSSVETCANLNSIFNQRLFIPVLGDPKKSLITRTDKILNNFLQGKNVDDLIECPFFEEIFKAFPTKGINKPIYLACHSPWTKEEDDLLQCALKRFTSPDDIQKYVMPGRSITMISQHFKDSFRSVPIEHDLGFVKSTQDSAEEDITLEVEEESYDEDDDQLFIVSEDMRFAEIELPKRQ